MLHKRSYFLSYVMALVLIGVYAKKIIGISVGHKSFDISLISLPILIAAMALIWRQKINWIARGSVLLIPVMLGLYLMVSSYHQTNVLGGLQKSYYKINEIKATDLTPVQSVRPLRLLHSRHSLNQRLRAAYQQFLCDERRNSEV